MVQSSEYQTTSLPTGTVTFLFTDMEGSTRLLQKDPGLYKSALEDHLKLIREAVVGAGGVEVSTEGEAFFVVFPTAPHAIEAVVAAQKSLAGYPWPEDAEVRIRMGLHTGEAVLGGDNYVGIDVNRAARIAAAAHGGQVLLSSATKELVERTLPQGVTLEDLGEHRFKDLARPEQIYQLVIEGLKRDFPPIRSLETPTNLPVQLTNFIGRERELEEVKSLLREARLLTLSGPGGTGKTRLALQAAATVLEDFDDGVFFVALAPIVDPELFASTVAQALSISETGATPIIETLEQELSSKKILLVLDNFEQIVEAAPQVSRLLSAAPDLKLIVTTREALRISGEQEFHVPSLALPDPSHLPSLDALSQYDAVALFIQRARAVAPDFEVNAENAPAIAEITARVDGLPLAIELAAARIRLLSPGDMLARMQDRLALLRSGARDLPQRQKTLRDAIAWSYDLLSPEEQVLFRRLGIFMGGFTLEAAEAVVGEGIDIDLLDGLELLLDKSLLRQDQREREEGRFSMLETIRAYAVERLDESGEKETVAERHGERFARLAEEAEPHLETSEGPAWLARLEAEHDNIRAALRFLVDSGDLEPAMMMAGRLWRFWHFRAHFAEARHWFEEMLSSTEAQAPTPGRAKALSGLAGIVYWGSDYAGAESLYRRALEIYRELDDQANMAWTIYSIATTFEMRGDFDPALPVLQEALGIYRSLGDQMGIAMLEGDVGWVEMFRGNAADARAPLEHALRISRELGNTYNEANTLLALGYVGRLEGDFEEQERKALEAASLFSSLGDATGIALSLNLLSDCEVRRKNFERALRLAGAAEMIREELGGGVPPEAMQIEDPRATLAGTVAAGEIEKHWMVGRSMSMEEALQYARREGGASS